MKSDGDRVMQGKNYFIGFVVSLIIHGILLLLIPKPLKVKESVMETALLEVQFLNEEMSTQMSAQKSETHETKAQPPASKPVPQSEPKVSEPTPVDETSAEIVEEVIKEKPVEAPQNPVIEKSAKISNTPSSSTTYSVVQSTQLDGKSFKPFGNKKPIYPPIARKSQIEGWVKVKVLVNEKGKVLKALVLDYQGHPSFKNATLGVARSWRFPIPTQKGQRVRTWYTQKVVFRLRD